MLDAELPEELRGPRTYLTSVWRTGSRDLRLLCDGLRRLDEQRLRTRIRTGLDSLVTPAPVERSPAEMAAELIRTLQSDNELAGLARLAHDLCAAVALPRRVSQFDEMHLGGFSDIANRGPLDRLLLSELAYDDLTLATRVAMNEAIYLRREAPPRSPPRTRGLLLDSGLRSWGVPRVLETAVALAMTAGADKRDDVRVWRADGRSVVQVDLTTKAGLMEHLERLATTVHPGASLAAWKRALVAIQGACDPILVTTTDVLADLDFLRALAESELGSLFVASVNRRGEFRLGIRGPHGERPLRRATLDIQQLLPKPASGPATPLIDPHLARALPAICLVRPFPLRLPHAIDFQQMWVADDLILAIPHNRRLMLWDRSGYGASEVTASLPPGLLQWHSERTSDDLVYALVGPAQSTRLSLLTVDLERRSCAAGPLELAPGAVRAIADHNGWLFVICNDRVDVFAVGDLHCLATIKLPRGTVWKTGRYFKDRSDRWLALGYDGMQATLEPVLSAKTGLHCPKLAGLFDRAAHDGPWGLSVHGDLYDSVADMMHMVRYDVARGPVELILADRRGDQLVVGIPSSPGKSGSAWRLVDVERRTSRQALGTPQQQLLSSATTARITTHSLRHRFQHVAWNHGLVLISPKQAHLKLTYDERHKRIQLRPVSPATSLSGTEFKSIASPENVGYELKQATLDDGTRVYTDSRGLLHIKSADQRLPEVTLVLHDAHLAGWCSRGGAWGPKYFTGLVENTSPPSTCLEFLARYAAHDP